MTNNKNNINIPLKDFQSTSIGRKNNEKHSYIIMSQLLSASV